MPGPAAPTEPYAELPDASREALERYLAYLGDVRRRADKTLRNYRTDIEDFLRFLATRGAALEEAGRSDGRAYLGWLRDRGTAEGSVKRRATTIRGFYGWLDREGVTLRAKPGDSMLRLRYPKSTRRLPQFLSTTEVERLVEGADAQTPAGLRDRALLELLYAAGLRVSEVAGLDVGHLDLVNRQVRVRGKGDKTRIGLFGEPAHDALREYIERGRPALLPAGRTADALFLNRSGGRLSARSIQTVVRRSGTQAGILRRVHPHLLRHTFATHMLEGDADLRIVQHLLGHSSADTTQIYTAVAQRRHEALVTSALQRARTIEAERRERGER